MTAVRVGAHVGLKLPVELDCTNDMEGIGRIRDKLASLESGRILAPALIVPWVQARGPYRS